MSGYKLTEEILKRSQAKVWDIAKLEWKLNEIYEAEEPETCLCGHFPIIEICILQNKLNTQFATVGNCCVKKFIGLPSDLIFQAVKRVRKDNQKSLNAEAIQHAYEKGIQVSSTHHVDDDVDIDIASLTTFCLLVEDTWN